MPSSPRRPPRPPRRRPATAASSPGAHGSQTSPAFSRAALDAAATQREVTLTTTGRKSGAKRDVTIWVATDGRRVYVRSGGGMAREWPQNLMAQGEATIHLGGEAIRVRPRHVTDPEEARATSRLARDKYGSYVKPSRPGEPLTTGESAAFELIPV